MTLPRDSLNSGNKEYLMDGFDILVCPGSSASKFPPMRLHRHPFLWAVNDSVLDTLDDSMSKAYETFYNRTLLLLACAVHNWSDCIQYPIKVSICLFINPPLVDFFQVTIMHMVNAEGELSLNLLLNSWQFRSTWHFGQVLPGFTFTWCYKTRGWSPEYTTRTKAIISREGDIRKIGLSPTSWPNRTGCQSGA